MGVPQSYMWMANASGKYILEQRDPAYPNGFLHGFRDHCRFVRWNWVGLRSCSAAYCLSASLPWLEFLVDHPRACLQVRWQERR